MKKSSFLFLLAIILLSGNVHAYDVICKVTSANYMETMINSGDSVFTIYDFDTNSPDISIDGGLLEDPVYENNRYLMAFSNECDNMININVDADEYQKMKDGTLSEIKGKMIYSSAALSDDIPNGEILAEIFCQKK